jgi:hypothetical protein
MKKRRAHHHDSRLSTLLAAILATLRFPMAFLWRRGPVIATACLVAAGVFFLLALVSVIGVVGELIAALWLYPREMAQVAHDVQLEEVLLFASLFAYGILFAGSPFYVLLGAQVCGLAVRGAVSRRRELLADADAVLLTRDPEGLALALVKLAATTGISMKAPAAAGHLYVVEPLLSVARWWERRYASHPPIAERIAVLSQMGVGISPASRQAAEAAAAAFLAGDVDEAPRASIGAAELRTPREQAPLASPRDLEPTTSATDAISYVRLTTPMSLYLAPDPASAMVRQLSGGAVLALLGVEGGFLRVRTRDSATGYIMRTTSVSWESS